MMTMRGDIGTQGRNLELDNAGHGADPGESERGRHHRRAIHRIASADPETAVMEVEVAVRLFGATAIGMAADGDPRLDRQVRQSCRRLGVQLFVTGSAGDPAANGLVLGNRNLRPDPGNLADVEPCADVSDTIRRLCNHLAPGINNH